MYRRPIYALPERRFAESGFAAIAPDLYGRFGAPSGDGGTDFTVEYADAGHAFFDDQRPSYVADSAQDAWNRTLAFFNKYLRA